jgi:hypothetical protein
MGEPGVVWLFHAESAAFEGATFTSLQLAESRIPRYSLSGLLTAHPVSKSVCDWAPEKNSTNPSQIKRNLAVSLVDLHLLHESTFIIKLVLGRPNTPKAQTSKS